MRGVNFDAETDIPSLEGKVIWVACGLLGRPGRFPPTDSFDAEKNQGTNIEIIVALARHHPKRIYVSGIRSLGCDSLIDDIEARAGTTEIVPVECDLSSLDSVEKAARDFPWHFDRRLDLLICNGHARPELDPAQRTRDGWELQFGANFLAHALLTNLLLPTLKRTQIEHNSNVRVVLGTWGGIRNHGDAGKQIQYDNLRKTPLELFGQLPLERYAQSKLAMILYAAEMARQHPSVTFVSAHGGTTVTWAAEEMGVRNQALPVRLFLRVAVPGGMRNPREGAQTHLWAATCPKERLKNGACYGVNPGQEDRRAKKLIVDDGKAVLYEYVKRHLAPRLIEPPR